MNAKKITACITGSILLLLVVYGILFIRISGEMVFRYTEEYHTGADCSEKEQIKIGKLKKLSKLYVDSRDIKSLDFVYDLSGIKKLDIGLASPDMDMSFLSDCSGLETLYLFGMKLDNFENVSELTNLKDIDLSFCGVCDISGIKNLKALRSFSLYDDEASEVTGIGELSELPELVDISLNHASKQEISAITDCKNLTSLSLIDSDESIDVTELLKTEKLEKLYIPGSSLENAEKLLELKELKYVTFSENMADKTLIDSLEKKSVSVKIL